MAATVGEREASEAQHARGCLTARERLDILFDHETRREIGGAGQGVITARGLVRGRPVMAFSQDVTDAAGVMTQAQATAIAQLVDQAVATGAPIVGIHDSPGAALVEGLACLTAQAMLMQGQARAQGRVPQLSLLFGPTVGTAALSPGLADFTFMLDRASALYLAGPQVLRQALGEIAGVDALGAPSLHAAANGMADGVFSDEIELLFAARDLLDLLPTAADQPAPLVITADTSDRLEPGLDQLVPLDPAAPYDMRELARALADERAIFELQPDHAANMICALARIDGRTVGILGSQPLVLGGVIDCAAARKATRFARFCDRFAIPMLVLLDSTGVHPGAAEQSRGIVRDVADLLAVLARATVPRITLVTRRAIGAAWAIFAPQRGASAICYAWPGAEIAAMAGDAAAALLFETGDEQKKRDYAAAIADPSHAVTAGFVDAVIRPATTRQTIAAALRHAAPAQEFGSMLPKPSPTGAGHTRERNRNG
ncbi:propionyl-CoA carboxylase beta chain [Sphingomonas sp. OV641]|uniref:carboxyl transferase domain-containing protein n=1 Tax=Sphingomonas sp. OV641 TaxID=1881068 RepID=UPI0008C0ECA2|nr:carboxyl transferase domain-containing protein [Sphingomonas sp. OV641]SEJ64652.1 propionyl-CoA carboxylase beta chain [Sphingomonas sp. OV641]